MAIMFYKGAILFINGMIAMAEACCCDGTTTTTTTSTTTGGGTTTTTTSTTTGGSTECPSGCTTCADTYTASIASSSCPSCSSFPSIANGKSKTITRLTGEGQNCIWEYAGQSPCDVTLIHLACDPTLTPDQWYVSVQVSAEFEGMCFAVCTAVFYKTGMSDCPTGTYTGTCGTVVIS